MSDQGKLKAMGAAGVVVVGQQPAGHLRTEIRRLEDRDE